MKHNQSIDKGGVVIQTTAQQQWSFLEPVIKSNQNLLKLGVTDHVQQQQVRKTNAFSKGETKKYKMFNKKLKNIKKIKGIIRNQNQLRQQPNRSLTPTFRQLTNFIQDNTSNNNNYNINNNSLKPLNHFPATTDVNLLLKKQKNTLSEKCINNTSQLLSGYNQKSRLLLMKKKNSKQQFLNPQQIKTLMLSNSKFNTPNTNHQSRFINRNQKQVFSSNNPNNNSNSYQSNHLSQQSKGGGFRNYTSDSNNYINNNNNNNLQSIYPTALNLGYTKSKLRSLSSEQTNTNPTSQRKHSSFTNTARNKSLRLSRVSSKMMQQNSVSSFSMRIHSSQSNLSNIMCSNNKVAVSSSVNNTYNNTLYNQENECKKSQMLIDKYRDSSPSVIIQSNIPIGRMTNHFSLKSKSNNNILNTLHPQQHDEMKKRKNVKKNNEQSDLTHLNSLINIVKGIQTDKPPPTSARINQQIPPPPLLLNNYKKQQVKTQLKHFQQNSHKRKNFSSKSAKNKKPPRCNNDSKQSKKNNYLKQQNYTFSKITQDSSLAKSTTCTTHLPTVRYLDQKLYSSKSQKLDDSSDFSTIQNYNKEISEFNSKKQSIVPKDNNQSIVNPIDTSIKPLLSRPPNLFQISNLSNLFSGVSLQAKDQKNQRTFRGGNINSLSTDRDDDNNVLSQIHHHHHHHYNFMNSHKNKSSLNLLSIEQLNSIDSNNLLQSSKNCMQQLKKQPQSRKVSICSNINKSHCDEDQFETPSKDNISGLVDDLQLSAKYSMYDYSSLKKEIK